MLKKVVDEGLLFVCTKCFKERRGSEIKDCEHLYMDYVMKGGSCWEKECKVKV